MHGRSYLSCAATVVWRPSQSTQLALFLVIVNALLVIKRGSGYEAPLSITLAVLSYHVVRDLPPILIWRAVLLISTLLWGQ